MTETATALEVLTPAGELLDVREAETDKLAEAVTQVANRRDELSDLETVLADELLRRLDRRGKWTLRVGDPEGEVQYEIKAPSPDAGTKAYDPHALEKVLRALVARDTIDEEGATAALKRTITFTAEVPLAGDLEQAAKILEGVQITVAGAGQLELRDVKPTRAVVQAGINALLKVPGTDSIEKARVDVAAPTRRAKVKAIRKGAA